MPVLRVRVGKGRKFVFSLPCFNIRVVLLAVGDPVTLGAKWGVKDMVETLVSHCPAASRELKGLSAHLS